MGRSWWSRFWDAAAWWKAVVLVVAYFAVYEFAPLALLPFSAHLGAAGTTQNVLLTYIVPIAFGGLLLVAFGMSVGWLRDVFGRQPVRGRGWMWIAVVAVLLFNVLRFATVDYGSARIDYVLVWLLTGLFIGFAEEMLTRGYVVRIMRRAGHTERTAALVSAALFALLHAGNLLSGQALGPTLLQLVYTFFFGICMYLALRVTGTILAPILLHASTDPSIFLQTEFPASGTLTALAGVGNIVVIVVGLVLVFCIRGRVGAEADRTV